MSWWSRNVTRRVSDAVGNDTFLGELINDYGAEYGAAVATLGGTAAVPYLAALYSQEEPKRIEAENAAREQAFVNEQQRGINDRIGRVRSLYGIGTSTEAQGNARTLADSLQQFYRDHLGAGLRQVNDQFGRASRVGRQNLARVGQLGSSLDANTQSGNLAEFLRARQRAISQAARQRDSLATGLTRQRLGLEEGIRGGTIANPDFERFATEQRGLFDQARAQIPEQAVATAFRTAGEGLFQNQVQQAQGNQGLRAFFGGAGGRST